MYRYAGKGIGICVGIGILIQSVTILQVKDEKMGLQP